MPNSHHPTRLVKLLSRRCEFGVTGLSVEPNAAANEATRGMLWQHAASAVENMS